MYKSRHSSQVHFEVFIAIRSNLLHNKKWSVVTCVGHFSGHLLSFRAWSTSTDVVDINYEVHKEEKP